MDLYALIESHLFPLEIAISLIATLLYFLITLEIPKSFNLTLGIVEQLK